MTWYMNMKMYSLMLLAIILTGIVAPIGTMVYANAQQGQGDEVTTPTSKGVEALIFVLRRAVERARELFIKWNVSSEEEAWSRLEEINTSIANVTELLNASKIDEARKLAISLLKEIAELVRDMARKYGEHLVNATNATIGLRHRLELKIKIRVLNNTINILLNLTTRIKEINATLAEKLRIQLEEAKDKLSKALEALEKGNVSEAKELIKDVEGIVKKVRKTMDYIIIHIVKRRIHWHIGKAIERIRQAIEILKNRARELEKMNLTTAAAQLREVIAKLQETISKLKNITAEELNITIAPAMLARIYISTMKEVHILRGEVKHYGEHAEKVKNIEPYVNGLIGLVGGLSRALQQISEHMKLLPGEAKQLIEDVVSSIDELKDTIKELVNATQIGDESKVKELKEKIHELIEEIRSMIEELKDEIKHKPLLKPILIALDRIEESLGKINVYVEKALEKVVRTPEERKKNRERVMEGLEDLEEKIKKIKEIVEEKGKRKANMVEVKVRLENMLKLLKQVRIQLKNNNTEEAVKLMLQLKQLAIETEKACIRLGLGKEISAELAKTVLIIEILIDTLRHGG